MSSISRLAGLLLVTTAFVSPSLAFAQADPDAVPETAEEPVDVSVPGAEEELEVSVPGGNEILVTGRRDRNVTRRDRKSVV